MFKVIDKTTGEVFTVYGLSGTHFVIYDEKLDWWFYKNMDECRPFVASEDVALKIDPEVFRRCIK